MTRQELIQSLEQHCHETEADLAVSKQALNLLRNGIYAPGVAKKLRSGPIVYGNGHHDGKKGPGSNPNPRSVIGSTIETRKVLERSLQQHKDGLTVAQMENILRNANIEFSRHTVHNSIRALKPMARKSDSGSSNIYSLPGAQ